MAIEIIFAHKKAMDADLEKTKHKAKESGRADDKTNYVRKEEKYSKWVFPSPIYRGDHITNVQKAAERVKEHSGVADFKLHDLRRTTASMMTSAGHVMTLLIKLMLLHLPAIGTKTKDLITVR